jgi:hypothetical protein
LSEFSLNVSLTHNKEDSAAAKKPAPKPAANAVEFLPAAQVIAQTPVPAVKHAPTVAKNGNGTTAVPGVSVSDGSILPR